MMRIFAVTAGWWFGVKHLDDALAAVGRLPDWMQDVCVLPERKPERLEMDLELESVDYRDAARTAAVRIFPAAYRAGLAGRPRSILASGDVGYESWVLTAVAVPSAAGEEIPRRPAESAGADRVLAELRDGRLTRAEAADWARRQLRDMSSTSPSHGVLEALSLADLQLVGGAGGRSEFLIPSAEISSQTFRHG